MSACQPGSQDYAYWHGKANVAQANTAPLHKIFAVWALERPVLGIDGASLRNGIFPELYGGNSGTSVDLALHMPLFTSLLSPPEATRLGCTPCTKLEGVWARLS